MEASSFQTADFCTSQRYFIYLSYKGTRYHGWQRQINASSVQQTLEEALSKLTGEPVEVTGAGRTDTGVHASCYVAHFDLSRDIDVSSSDFLYHLNALLPYDIAVSRIKEVASDMHARFSAVEREYKYYITTVKDPFKTETAFQHTAPLDMDKMNQAASRLLEYDDFTSFAKLHSDNKTNICKVTKAEFVRDGTMIVFTICADRFLRNMVRAIVGSLIDVGRGKISVGDFDNIICSKDRAFASGSAMAHGLFLSDIKYNL